MLVLANQTVLGQPLVDAINERSAATPAEFTVVIPAARIRPRSRPQSARGGFGGR